jgi:hypothetical protein
MDVSYGLEELGFESLQEQETYLFSKRPRPAVRPTLRPTQWGRKVFFSGTMLPEREADNSPTSSAEVKNQ